MAHKLTRFTRKRLMDRPLLATEEQLEYVLDILKDRDTILTQEEIGIIRKQEGLAVGRDIYSSSRGVSGANNIAVIPISGPLSYEQDEWATLCDLCTYQGILSQMEDAVVKGYETVVLDIDSGGGEAYSAFETSQEVRKIADDNGINLIAYVDGMAASAAYAWACVAHKLIINPDGQAGSIGVLVRLINDSKKMEMEGYDVTYITAGESKIPFAKDGSYRKEFLDELQERVDSLYSKFVSHVAEMRGISEQSVRETQAKVFDADKALELGLVDEIMTRAEFNGFLEKLEQGEEMPLKIKNENRKEEMSDMAKSDLEAQLAELEADKEKLGAEVQTLSSDKADLEKRLADAEEKVAALETEKEALSTELESTKKAQEEAKMQARKDSLKEVLDAEKADVVFAQTESMNDEQFSVVLEAYQTSYKKEQDTEMFKEEGFDAEADSERPEESAVMARIKQMKKSK